MKLAIVNLKGGSGKTVSGFFLATVLSWRGRTLLVDCDPQGSALSWAAAAEEYGSGDPLPFAVMGLPVKAYIGASGPLRATTSTSSSIHRRGSSP